MSAVGERKFVIKHVFENVSSVESISGRSGPTEEHFEESWRIDARAGSMCPVVFFLESPGCKYRITFDAVSKFLKTDGTWKTYSQNSCSFICTRNRITIGLDDKSLSDYLIDGKLTVEVEIEIKKARIATWRSFDDDVAKECSDVVFSVGIYEFHVNKMYLSLHSTYFKSLFAGKFANSKRIKINKIDPEGFQDFLELLYGESAINEYNIDAMLEFADMYDAQTAIRRCEEFLLEKSEAHPARKFRWAVNYKLDALKEKCLSEAKTTDQIRELAPCYANDIGPDAWKELFLKACSSE
ncbi:unnamed protein product [Caenorhabditis nigoni]